MTELERSSLDAVKEKLKRLISEHFTDKARNELKKLLNLNEGVKTDQYDSICKSILELSESKPSCLQKQYGFHSRVLGC